MDHKEKVKEFPKKLFKEAHEAQLKRQALTVTIGTPMDYLETLRNRDSIPFEGTEELHEKLKHLQKILPEPLYSMWIKGVKDSSDWWTTRIYEELKKEGGLIDAN